MPTIEIASIDSTGLGLSQADFHVAIIEENKLESHRGLFYTMLRQQNGVIVHVGNPDYKADKEGGYTAGAIVDWSFEPTADPGAKQQFRFRLLKQYKPNIDKLLKIALDHSPINKVYFLTDYQFGPENGKTEIIYTITDFWTQHDNEGLGLNTLYEMYGR